MEAIVRKSVSEVFGLNDIAFAKTQCRVLEPTADTPVATPGFKFNVATLRRLIIWAASVVIPPGMFDAKMKRNVLVFGPTGCGKTKLIQEFCARTGRPLFRVQCSEDTELSHFFGTWKLGQSPSGPVMTFVDGPVLRWARTPNAVLLLDEQDQLLPTVAMGLNAVLDGDDILVPETGERVKIAPGALIAATGNTNGRGSAGGNGGSGALYKGAKRQNIATLDRYFVINTSYLSEEEERELMIKQLRINETAATAMAKLATKVRSLFLGINEDAGAQGEPLEFTITTRNLLNWGMSYCLLTATGMDSKSAFTESLSMTILDFGTAAERKAVLDLWNTIIADDQI